MKINDYKDLEIVLGVPIGELVYLAASMEEQVHVFYKKKKSGEPRKICDASPRLKEIQRLINKRILQQIPLPNYIHGSVVGKSPRTNAEQHMGKPFVYGLDVKDFYPSVHYTKIYKVLLACGFSDDVSGLLTRLTTYQGSLAQGFPTSSTLANLILSQISPRIENLCKHHGIAFTFYQDDLTISGGYRIPNLIGLFSRIMAQEGFELHHLPRKKKPMPETKRQEVTGYVVNQKVNVAKDYYRRLRATIHLCKVKGIEFVAGDVPVEKFRSSIMGKIQYILDVNPERGKKLLAEFQKI